MTFDEIHHIIEGFKNIFVRNTNLSDLELMLLTVQYLKNIISGNAHNNHRPLSALPYQTTNDLYQFLIQSETLLGSIILISNKKIPKEMLFQTTQETGLKN